MADFTFEPPTEFQEQLARCADLDAFATRMIDDAIPILEKTFKQRLNGVLKHPTGELINSIKAKKAAKTKNGAFIGYVTAIGTAKGKTYNRVRKSGSIKTEKYRNYQKLLAIEYGTSRGQAPTPVIETTVRSCETQVVDRMQEFFIREVLKE